MLKTLYSLAALLAILHIVGLVGAAGYLYSNGTLTTQNIKAAADALRGRGPVVASAGATQDKPAAETTSSEESISREQDHEEMARRGEERRVSELHQKQVAVNLLMQKVTEDLEKLEGDRVIFEQKNQKHVKDAQQEGFKKTLQLLESAAPDSAKTLMFQGLAPEEAAELMLQMSTRKGMKILEAGLTDPTLQGRALQVFKMIRETAPAGSDWSKIPAPQE